MQIQENRLNLDGTQYAYIFQAFNFIFSQLDFPLSFKVTSTHMFEAHKTDRKD